jgi:hypothetical protein
VEKLKPTFSYSKCKTHGTHHVSEIVETISGDPLRVPCPYCINNAVEQEKTDGSFYLESKRGKRHKGKLERKIRLMLERVGRDEFEKRLKKEYPDEKDSND